MEDVKYAYIPSDEPLQRHIYLRSPKCSIVPDIVDLQELLEPLYEINDSREN